MKLIKCSNCSRERIITNDTTMCLCPCGEMIEIKKIEKTMDLTEEEYEKIK